ncbi:MAG TPA: MarR family winged helix-turn-helix transcriptional regulator [Sporichthyaceae bacterium]|jgi:DNA-binding MarR family transcriptional regulator|nr:MarR family winged helix-turn-helix transcriptional regulator [Sporichthyaceae bacterium]
MSADPIPAAPTGACGALGGDLGWALGAVFRSYGKAATAVMADLPGGPRSYQVLSAAAHDQPGTQLALAARMGVDRTVMTYLLDALEEAKLVTRVPDPADRRARRIGITKRGAKLLADLDQRLALVETQVLSALDAEERAMFRSLLQRIATQAEALDPESACEVTTACPVS